VTPAATSPTPGNVRGRIRGSDYGHHDSHRSLISSVGRVRQQQGPGARRGIDLLAVPAAREAGNLREAAEVVGIAESHLLVLCSRATVPAAAYFQVTDLLPEEQVTVTQVPQGWSPTGWGFEADGSPLFRRRTSDTHLKRNLALAVARGLGCARLLFLDDDVHGFGTAELAVVDDILADRADAPSALGWAFDDFPDNSIVCHAYRAAGGAQSTFVGAGALAVRVTDETPHFPRTYNEDWLFMLPLINRRKSELVFAGSLRQTAFDPFAEPVDAVQQEAGDTIAEGLFSLLHDGDLTAALSRAYWRDVLHRRRRFILEIKARLSRAGGADAARACDALDQVLMLGHRQGDWPKIIEGWVRAWRRDGDRWSHWLSAVPRRDSVPEMVSALGLDVFKPRSGAASDLRCGPRIAAHIAATLS
jgi:hypothetical protein